ncbi:hypothetical protein TNIN_340381 [Trichonephila inaurata madagascariensis]|uniref:Uncharacterized protein n=1 Tax=Trichonephila inaurata madagascariensis TaxID=2747483 RepID=A0A8X6XD07_9ARAC|nr:hypothetical protein TNIN_340381 [Trichonephila inaurata madagascariensis]
MSIAVWRPIFFKGFFKGIGKKVCLLSSVVDQASVAQQWGVYDLLLFPAVHDFEEGSVQFGFYWRVSSLLPGLPESISFLNPLMGLLSEIFNCALNAVFIIDSWVARDCDREDILETLPVGEGAAVVGVRVGGIWRQGEYDWVMVT